MLTYLHTLISSHFKQTVDVLGKFFMAIKRRHGYFFSYFFGMLMQKGRLVKHGGFTLVELLVSISILLIIVGTVVVRFMSFDSTVLLKSLTYDIAFSIRQAQTYSVSVVGSSTGFRDAYGISFTNTSNEYTLFNYEEDTNPYYNPADGFVTKYQLGRSFVIADVCVQRPSLAEECGISQVDIGFQRPEYMAIFYVDSLGDVVIESVSVKVQADDGGGRVGVIKVGYAGQITVSIDEE